MALKCKPIMFDYHISSMLIDRVREFKDLGESDTIQNNLSRNKKRTHVWNGRSASKIFKHEHVQRNATRYILNYPGMIVTTQTIKFYLCPTDLLYIKVCYKCVHGLALDANEFVHISSTVHTSTRSSHDPSLIVVNLCCANTARNV